jgi:hypothetical protein
MESINTMPYHINSNDRYNLVIFSLTGSQLLATSMDRASLLKDAVAITKLHNNCAPYIAVIDRVYNNYTAYQEANAVKHNLRTIYPICEALIKRYLANARKPSAIANAPYVYKPVNLHDLTHKQWERLAVKETLLALGLEHLANKDYYTNDGVYIK